MIAKLRLRLVERERQQIFRKAIDLMYNIRLLRAIIKISGSLWKIPIGSQERYITELFLIRHVSEYFTLYNPPEVHVGQTYDKQLSVENAVTSFNIY